MRGDGLLDEIALGDYPERVTALSQPDEIALEPVRAA
jgi:hypothetical protein